MEEAPGGGAQGDTQFNQFGAAGGDLGVGAPGDAGLGPDGDAAPCSVGAGQARAGAA